MSLTVEQKGPRGATWHEIRDWDERYYLHPFRALDEYHHVAVDRGEGPYLYLADGRRILDFLSGYACVNMGQSRPRIHAAIAEAASRISYLSEPWTSEYRSKAAKLIVEDLLGADGWAGAVRFVATGSEAIELAIMVARLFTGREIVITQEFSFHGWTTAAALATDLRGMRGNLSTAGGEVREVPGFGSQAGFMVAPAPSHWPSWRGRADGVLPCVAETERLIREIGLERVAAFVCEVSLAGAGIHPPPEYIPQIRDMTRRLGILLIDDEVICGFGRMGRWFGYQAFPGVTPDLMAMGKGMTGAAMPAAGMVVSREIADFLKARRWWLPITMAGHPVAMAALVANIEAMIAENAVANAARVGEYLGSRLRELEHHSCVGHVAGDGLFWLVELVKDKRTTERFIPDDRRSMGTGDLAAWPVNRVTESCLERGVFIGGFVPNTLRIAPPLTISEAECDEAIAALDEALAELDRDCRS
jgi:taurine--2-oxoglutarate transaminase